MSFARAWIISGIFSFKTLRSGNAILLPMPTFIGHSLVALSLGASVPRTFLGRAMSLSAWLAVLVLMSLLPDLDVLMLRWLPYAHPLSHRGLSHSLFFALIAAGCLTLACSLAGLVHGRIRTLIPVWLVLAAALGSHGLLDACTDGGLGIALFSPLTFERYFFPLRPLPVTCLSPAGLLSPYMLHVYTVELALFGPFCLAAWLSRADLSGPPVLTTVRRLVAAVLVIIGIGAWIVRCQSVG
jgi:inner membrane protein